MMQKFRESRKPSSKKEQTVRLENLSPDKYGRAAYNQSFFTPSKLADNVLYKETTNFKKHEETAQRLRQVQANYKLLDDKFNKIVKEKVGIQQSLSLQIQMYKKLIGEMQISAESRLKDAQEAFKKEIDSIIADKEEQVRFIQSQKEQLQNVVNQLQQIGNQLEQRLNTTTVELQETTKNLNNKIQEGQILQNKLEAAEQLNSANIAKYQKIVQDLKDKVLDTEREWRQKKDDAVAEKNKQIKQIQKQHKQELNKASQQRENQRLQKQEELKQLQSKLQNEVKRFSEIIETKNKSIEDLNKQAAESQEKSGNMIRGYEQEIIGLSNEKSRLFEEVDKLNEQNTRLNVMLRDQQFSANKEKTNLENYILKLKEDITYSQGNFLRERDRNVMTYEDSTKQIINLKRQNAALVAQIQNYAQKAGDSEALAKQVRKLRDMLMESSFQLQKCKQQFVKIGKQRDLLAIKYQEVAFEKNSLRRLKCERQEQARSWRDSYYLTRSRSRRR